MGWFLRSLETPKSYPRFLLGERFVAQPHDSVFPSGLTRHGFPSCAEQESQGESSERLPGLKAKRDQPPHSCDYTVCEEIKL